MKKIILLLLGFMLLTGCKLGSAGRYQYQNGVIIDTKTGRTWERKVLSYEITKYREVEVEGLTMKNKK